MGKLGDDKTYELDASITRAHTLFTAQYTERIQAVRDQLFDQQNDQLERLNETQGLTPSTH